MEKIKDIIKETAGGGGFKRTAKVIENKVINCQMKPLDYFQPFQGELKKISEKNLKKLKESIIRKGFTAPLFIWQDKILDGHQRKIALESLAYDGYQVDGIPYVEIKADNEKDAKEILLTYVSQYADISKDGLAEFINLGGLDAIDLSSFIVMPKLEDMVVNMVEQDEVPEPDELEPKAKTGDIYQLGRHRIICGDSTDPEVIAKLMNGNKADMCFTDPPYNVDYQGGMGTHALNKRQGILNDKMDAESFYNFLLAACRNIVQFCNGGIYICMSSSELDSLKVAFETAGGHWQSFIIWVKNTFTLSRSDYQHTYEPILYGWPEGIKNHFFIEQRDNGNVWEDLRAAKAEFDGEFTTIKFSGFEVKIKGKAEGEIRRGKQKIDVWRYDKPKKSAEHPTMKPLELCAEAIKNSSFDGQIVMDIFLGSGSTLISAEQLNRTCYGCELDPKYIDVIIARWEKLTGGKAVKIE